MRTSLKTLVSHLQERIIQLEQVVIDLEATNKKLVEENQLFKQENQLFKQENQQLKEKLGLNSANSSLSPSRDLYKQKQANRTPSSRNPGGQPGHQAHQYQLMQADEVINLVPTKCKCGEAIQVGEQYTREQKIEIPPIKP